MLGVAFAASYPSFLMCLGLSLETLRCCWCCYLVGALSKDEELCSPPWPPESSSICCFVPDGRDFERDLLG